MIEILNLLPLNKFSAANKWIFLEACRLKTEKSGGDDLLAQYKMTAQGNDCDCPEKTHFIITIILSTF